MNNKDISKTNKPKRTSIGGQAVMEGVMMRGTRSMCVAVRDADGVIRKETTRFKSIKEKPRICRVPILRGIINFATTLGTGVGILTRSAEVFGEGEPSKFEKWLSEKLHVNLMDVITTVAIVLGFALSIGLFFFLPQVIADLIGADQTKIGYYFIEGGIRLAIFVIYLALIMLMKDIRRTYMYHGAEHKTISCYERGLELTVENARKCTRVHSRCGTTFMFLVMFVSILVFALFNWVIKDFIDLSAIQNGVLRFLARFGMKLVLLPFVAGICYEIIKLLALSDSKWLLPFKAPGLLLQRLTTLEPTDDMLEVAITAFNQVMLMDADKSVPTEKFVVAKRLSEILADAKSRLKEKGIDEVDAEWIVAINLNLKRDELSIERFVNPKDVINIENMLLERLTFRPLWYIIGNTDFYGYKIFVDERVLIPAFETEELVACALKDITEDDTVLDLCTGSGAIAIAVKKQTNATVVATDISEEALVLARKSAEYNLAHVEFILSDYFSEIKGMKFSKIISNPPYISEGEIPTLQREVKDYEPHIALSGGNDGLDPYRLIAVESPKYLCAGGIIYLECGENQAEKIAKMLEASDFSKIEIIKDIEGIQRIVRAVKNK